MIQTFDTFQLRPFKLQDAASLARHGNDRRIWDQVRDRFPRPYARMDAKAWIEYVKSYHPERHLAIDVGGEAVGCIGCDQQQDVYRISGEMGYWLGVDHWRKGIMKRAVAAILPYIFDTLNLHRIFATTFAGNPASARVLEHNGFRLEGTLRESILKNGCIQDQWLYALLHREWIEQHPASSKQVERR